MIRDPLRDKSYWGEWVLYFDEQITLGWQSLKIPSGSPEYEPQYVKNLAEKNVEQIIRRYSRGDPIEALRSYFEPLLDAWELSESLGSKIWDSETIYIRHTWAVNIDAYHGAFWKLSLALLLDIPDDQWQRLVALVGNEGEDALLDRLIASRSPTRKIGQHLCFPKPYARLLAAIEAPRDQQAELLKAFLDHWYPELGRYSKYARVPQKNPYPKPYWHGYVTPRGLKGGWYFGLWCLEAAAAVKAFGLDDSLCLGHRVYPGDFLRPNGPSTHPPRPDVLPKAAPEPEEASESEAEEAAPEAKAAAHAPHASWHGLLRGLMAWAWSKMTAPGSAPGSSSEGEKPALIWDLGSKTRINRLLWQEIGKGMARDLCIAMLRGEIERRRVNVDPNGEVVMEVLDSQGNVISARPAGNGTQTSP